MRVRAKRVAVFVLGLVFLTGCGGRESEQEKETPQPSGPAAAAQQRKEAAQSTDRKTGTAQREAEIQLPPAQSIVLRDALREKLMDRHTYDRVAAEVQSLIGVLGKHRLLTSIDRLNFLVGENAEKPSQQVDVSLCSLQQCTPDDFLFVEELEEIDMLDELEEGPLEDLHLENLDTEIVEDELTISPADELEAAELGVELSEFGHGHAPKNDLLSKIVAYQAAGQEGRGSEKGALVWKYGGTVKSESAVAAALKWLAEHQMPDGGWTFDHATCPNCKGACGNPGSEVKARNAATALALLPFLGAGQTHKQGKYKQTVKSGLYFLVKQMKVSPNGGSLHESGGRMYSHGLASIALCEAYAMTHDKGLHAPAQQTINFIVYAQDPVGGGWRYEPRQKGDTSVTGWQITALKSGHMAYLTVPPVTVKKAFAFLDSVQDDGGAKYGYTSPDRGTDATTAIGLLCRMYLGWKKDNPALKRGVKWLSDKGPSKGNMYYNYYATRVMWHWGGDEWKKWNGVIREQLVNSQVQNENSHEKGSWYFPVGGHGSKRGGRLYCTSMASMILEVYYIRRRQPVEEDFPD